MAAPMKQNRKRKAGAKNKKKGWKKVDIKELEDFLEDERLQERTGGLAADKSNESLYFVDSVITEKTTQDEETKQPKKPLRKHQRKNRQLKCFANLEPDPFTKAAKISHNVRTRPRVLARNTRSQTARDLQAQKQREQAKLEKAKTRVGRWKTTVSYDLWDGPQSDEKEEEDEHYREVTKKRRVNVPSYYHKKPSSLPGVEVPHPGASYNPTYEDHQDLLRNAHEVEVKKAKDLKRLFNALDAKFPSQDKAPTQETWLEEMSAGLHTDPTREDEVVAPGDDTDKISVNPPVRREDLKTRKQRRKDKQKKLEAQRLARRKEQKVKKSELNRLKSIKKEILKREAELEERAKQKAELQEKNKNRPKKLGKYKYVEPDLDLKLGGELTGSLRLLKPEGYLIKDRFHSLQKRNIIEPRERVKKAKRGKRKMFERKSHKEITV